MDLIQNSELPVAWPEGLAEACEAALVERGFAPVVTVAPDGLHCSDGATVRGVLSNYAGSSGHLAWLKSNRDGVHGKLPELAAIYAARIAAGRNYGGRNYQIDPNSLTNISGMGALAGLVVAGAPGVAWPPDFTWIASDNSRVAMDAAAMLGFAQDVAGYVAALVSHNRSVKDQIAAASSVAELEAIDLAAGWPDNS